MLELAELVLRLTGSRSKIERRPLPADDPRRRRPDQHGPVGVAHMRRVARSAALSSSCLVTGNRPSPSSARAISAPVTATRAAQLKRSSGPLMVISRAAAPSSLPSRRLPRRNERLSIGPDGGTPDKPVGDLLALADHLGIGHFTLVGHDWGGAIAWMAALQHPLRIRRLIIVNAPHPKVFQKSLFDDPEQRKASQYITRFRDTRIDQGLIGAGLERFFSSTFAQHVVGGIAGEDKAAYMDEWGQHGAMTAMLNWYRASSIVVPAPDEEVERPVWLDAPFPPVTQPTLVIWGMKDVALLPGQLELDGLVPDLTVVRVEDGGHFVPWEKPEAVTRAMREWLLAEGVPKS